MNSFQWNKRIVILSGEEETIKKSFSTFNDQKGIDERRLIFFMHSKDKLVPLLNKETATTSISAPKYIEEPFQFYLIGLDGGLKEKRKDPMSQKELFTLIDSMPMRANELRKGYE